MEWRGDNRGQSIQVGAILLFATLIIALSIYQASVVPEKNQRIEFDAYEDATDDFVQVRNTMLAAAGGDGSRGVTVKTGAQYPPRVFLVNDLEPAGRIATTDPATVTLGNVDASPTPLENVGTFVSEAGNSLSYETRRVRFEPDYNQFPGAPLVTANGYVFRAYDRPVPAAPQTLLDGNTISLTTVRGNFSASGYQVSVTAVPVSVRENTVTVTNDDPGPITLAVPSELNASEWRSSVFSEQAARPNVSVVDGPGDDTVTVELSGDRYQLELAAVELRERNDDNEVDEPPARYLVPDGSRDVTVAEGERARLVVEARDALNNPRSNAPVRFEVTDGSADLEAPDGTTGDPVVVRSDGDGESVAFFEPASGTATVEATLNVGTPAPEKTVTFTVRQSGSATDGNGSEAYAVEWLNSSDGSALACSSNTSCTLDAGGSSSATLDAGSDPVVDGGLFAFAVGNESVGAVTPSEQRTSPDGRSSTTFQAANNGTTNVYVSGGGSGDRMSLTVENATGTVAAGGETVAYVTSNAPSLETVTAGGATTTYSTAAGGYQAISDSNVDLDGDGATEIAYVDGNNDLVYRDAESGATTLDGSGSVAGTGVGVGDWDDDGTQEVVYSRNSEIYQVELGGTPTVVERDGPGGSTRDLSGSSVAGVGDFDGNGDAGIVYVDPDTGTVRYIESDGGSRQDTGVAVDSASTVSELADFDADGDAETALVDGNSDIQLVDVDGADGAVIDPGYDVSSTRLAALDVTGGSAPEVVHLDTSQRLRYVTAGGSAGFLTDDGGNRIVVRTGTGAS